MSKLQIQEILFQRIKERLSPNQSLADVVSEILYVSNDSAYRRIRGETPLVLEEAQLLCQHFDISLDHFLNIINPGVVFYTTHLNNEAYSFEKYLTDILNSLKLIASFQQKDIVYLTKDIPLFYDFISRPTFAFHYFFWMKSIMQHPHFVNAKFSMDFLTPSIEKLGEEILRTYCNIPSTEIWNTECVNSTISQIEYYREAGYFKSNEDVKLVYNSLIETIEHLRMQAELGSKFYPGENPDFKKTNFTFFYNRIVLGDNTILVTIDGKKVVYLNYEVLNYMRTENESFCNDIHQKLLNLIKRATMISNVGEKQRNVFFNALLRKIPLKQFENIKN
ncbi:MAG: hypothetical protein M3413_09920 [Bacteroidota bacterium]|nr:hypothetical protein [Bacteroidota bacterium]